MPMVGSLEHAGTGLSRTIFEGHPHGWGMNPERVHGLVFYSCIRPGMVVVSSQVSGGQDAKNRRYSHAAH